MATSSALSTSRMQPGQVQHQPPLRSSSEPVVPRRAAHGLGSAKAGRAVFASRAVTGGRACAARRGRSNRSKRNSWATPGCSRCASRRRSTTALKSGRSRRGRVHLDSRATGRRGGPQLQCRRRGRRRAGRARHGCGRSASARSSVDRRPPARRRGTASREARARARPSRVTSSACLAAGLVEMLDGSSRRGRPDDEVGPDAAGGDVVGRASASCRGRGEPARKQATRAPGCTSPIELARADVVGGDCQQVASLVGREGSAARADRSASRR